jgi:hypothetical protein
MAFDRAKFKALVHYICWACRSDPSKLGSVKLNNTLWVADFSSYYQRGEPITGARYVKRQFGPVPSSILSAVAELQAEGLITARDVVFPSYTQKEFKALSAPDTEIFTGEELRIADEAIRLVCDTHTARSISDHSHDHIWRAAEIGEEIPYFTIFATPGEIREDEREWARIELETLGRS